MWVQDTNGNYVNLTQAAKIFAADQGNNVVFIIAMIDGEPCVLKTTSVFTTVALAQAAIQTIISGTTLPN